MELVAYLNFNGQCKEAFAFYHKILGGEITFSMTYGESPMCDQMPPGTKEGMIMHTQLESGGATLMGADGPPQTGATQGIAISLVVDEPAEADRIFTALAEGGTVGIPIAETFWAHRFGMLTDRYGKPWLVNCMKPLDG